MFGASSGIGAVIAEKLAVSGYRVHAASRRETCAPHPRVIPVAADVRDYASVAETLSTASEDGRLAFVVNSAGVGYFAPLGEDYSAAWREILDTNVLGVVNLSSVLLGGDVRVDHYVQIGSIAAYRMSRTPGNAVYSAAKSAAAVLVDHLRDRARAAGSPLRVSHVAPGFVEGTGFGDDFFEYSPDNARPLYEPGQNLTAADVADVVAYVLATPPHVDLNHVLVRPTRQPD